MTTAIVIVSWASDHPHPDHGGAYLEELCGMVAPMTESGRRGSLGENVARASPARVSGSRGQARGAERLTAPGVRSSVRLNAFANAASDA